MISVQMNSADKTRCFDAVHLTPPHSVMPVTASDGFTNGGITQTLDFKKKSKKKKSNQTMPSRTKSFLTNNGLSPEQMLYFTLIW